MTQTIELATSLIQIQMSEKETGTNPINVQIPKNGYVEKVSTNKSPEALEVEVPTNIPQVVQIPYHHPHHKSCYDKHQNK